MYFMIHLYYCERLIGVNRLTVLKGATIMMDEMEFERRVRACTQKLFRVCYAILPERADRDDAIQEALVKAWQKRGTLRNDSVFESWLIRIAMNECRNILRRRKRMPADELNENSSVAFDSITDLSLHDAIRNLDFRLRMPIVLHYMEGYTMEETAKLLRIPLGTAKHRLKQAKSILKEQLREE